MRRVATLLAFGLAASLATSVNAGGLFAGVSGSQGMQRAGAFVARADDPTAIMFNPAGLLKTRRYELYLGSNVISISQSFQRQGIYPPQDLPDYNPMGSCASQTLNTVQPGYVCARFPRVENSAIPQPVPFLAATQRLGRWALGEGVFGYQANPNREFPAAVATPGASDAPAPQRYDVMEQEGLVGLPSVAAAYRLTEDLDVGARVSRGFGHNKSRTHVWGIKDLDENPDMEGDFLLDAWDTAIFGFAVGALYRPAPSVELGASYTGPTNIHAKGSGVSKQGIRLTDPRTGLPDYVEPIDDSLAKCAPGGTVAVAKACIDQNLPMSAVVGGRWIARDGWGQEAADLELDLVWENWSAVKDTHVVVDGRSSASHLLLQPTVVRHGFTDTFAVRLGGSIRPEATRAAGMTFRGGVSYDTAAAPLSWTRLDIDGADRYTVATGVAFDVGTWRFDLGGAFIYSPPRDVVNVPIADPNSTANHVQPDPGYALQKPDEQFYHPFNEGHYETHYLVATAGVTARW